MKKKFLNLSAVKVKDLGEGVLEAVVASDREDRHGEIIEMEGINLSEYKKNPVVMWAHDYSQPPIAKAISVRKVAGKLISKMKFAIDEYPFAHQIYRLYKEGFLNAFSIGFIPLEMDGNRYTKSSMIEYSAVPIPANPDALALAKQKGIDVEMVQDVVNGKTHIADCKGKGGDRCMKFTKEQIKAILLGDSEYKFTEEEADEDLVAEVKAEIEAEKNAKEEAEKKAKDIQAAGLDAVGKLLDEKIGALKEELDAPVTKDVSTVTGATVKPASDSMPKEDKFKIWLKGMASHDMSEYKEVVKKDAMDTTLTAVIPPTEFIAEVLRLEEEYGVARRFATMRRTDRTSITGIKGGTDVQIFETQEAGVKQSTGATYTPWEITFRKFAAIAPVTDELLEDSAVDIWNDLTQRFARAYAQKEDELVFTDATSGIVNAASAATVAITGDSIEDITFDDLNEAVFSVPTPSMRNGRFYLNRTILGVIQRLKDKNDNYIWKPGVDGAVTGTIWGYPYELVEVLPALTDDAAETEFIVFGDLKNTVLAERTMLNAKIFDTGSVVDPDDEEATLNLLTQDLKALRVVKRFNSYNLFENAYALIVTGAAAS